MTKNWLLRILLLPLALLYGLGSSLNDYLYSKRVLKSITFSLPVISIGNLAVGGSGKSPHVEYLIQLLSPYIKVGVISRGYGRKSRGFRMVNRMDISDKTGDEPLQIKRKNPAIPVAVSESRGTGIPKLIGKYPDLQAVIMDDGFQHREVNPYLNILLTEFSDLYVNDFILPVGRLREWPSAAKRADAVVVSKSPADLTIQEAELIEKKLKLRDNQRLFFSYLEYGPAYYFFDSRKKLVHEPGGEIIVLTGIANPEPLLDHYQERVDKIHSLAFPDHHRFTPYDIGQLKKMYEQLEMKIHFVVTTEKDAVRLQPHSQFLAEHKIPIFIQPIQVKFHSFEGKNFDDFVKNKLLEFKS
jgi:tetraacyldisaccharide 4'-kinase